MRFTKIASFLLFLPLSIQFSTKIQQPVKSQTNALFSTVSTQDNQIDLGLTAELKLITDAFSSIPGEKMRYKQLFYMADQLAPMDSSKFILENKVPGCLSTVYIDCIAEKRQDGEVVVNYEGESDGLLTKGLVALLIRGLSGCTPDEISKVNPEFIKIAKISQTLTPGRNNGFLNMLSVMKQKAAQAATIGQEPLEETTSTLTMTDDIVTSFEEIKGKPIYNTMMDRLISLLKPIKIELVDNSYQYADKGQESKESHFELMIVAEAFDELSLPNRHQIVHLILGDVMDKIDTLEILPKTPTEDSKMP